MKTTITGRLLLPHTIKGPVYFIGRQPILTYRLEVVGYELLYRPTNDNYINVIDNDQATLSVILNTFSQAGLRIVVGSKKAFINITRNFLVGKFPIPLPPARTVLEISENIDLDIDLVNALKELSLLGYEFAIDGLTSINRIDKLADFVRYAKVDVSATPPDDLPMIISRLKEHSIQAVAEKVETLEEFHKCRSLGFDLFQGFFFSRPEIVPVRKIQTSRSVIAAAVASLKNPNVNVDEVARIISMDVTLGYRLFKLVNSGFYSLTVPITSLRHAINMIGLEQVGNWLNLLLYSKVTETEHDLNVMASTRSYLARALAAEMMIPNPDSFFLAGWFSVLDSLLEMPMQEVVEGINLSDTIVSGLLERKGYIGEVLNGIEALESGDYEPIKKLGFQEDKIKQIQQNAAEWASDVKNYLATPRPD